MHREEKKLCKRPNESFNFGQKMRGRMKNVKRPHISKTVLLSRLQNFLGGIENSPEELYNKKEMESETRQKLNRLTEAILQHTKAEAEFRQASARLHEVMGDAYELLQRLDSWAYMSFGRKSAQLSRFGKGVHHKTGPKARRKKKINEEPPIPEEN
jgi:hypothetical protein